MSIEEAAEETRALRTMVVDVIMLDGDQYQVRPVTRDYVAWEASSLPKRYGKASDVPFTYTAFLAFCAAKREGRFTGHFDTGDDCWVNQVSDLTTRQADVFPTKTAAEPA